MKYLIALLVLFGILLSFNLKSISVRDLSMLPEFKQNERVFYLDNSWLATRTIQPSDLAVIANPKEKDPPIKDRTRFIRRIAAKSGDQLSIKKRQLYINDQAKEESGILFTYRIVSRETIDDLKNHFDFAWIQSTPVEHMYDVLLSPGQAKDMESDQNIEQIRLLDDPALLRDKTIYPFSERNTWTLIDYGPFKIPGKGFTIELTEINLQHYRMILTQYEGVTIEVKGDRIFLNDQETRHYTFQKDYYFVLSDNRDYGEDSRTFGIIPEEFLIGRIFF